MLLLLLLLPLHVCSVLYGNHAKAVHGRHRGALLCLLGWGVLCVAAGPKARLLFLFR